MKFKVGWTIGAAVGMLIVLVFLAIVATRMAQTSVSAEAPQSLDSRR